jgi:drug/metabolite transporter (DMT)-like permease
MVERGPLWIFLLAGFAASILLALGLLMMKSRGEELPAAEGTGIVRAVIKWMGDPVWIGGLGVEAAGYALYMVALADAPVSIIAVVMQGGIAMFVVLAAVFLHERASTHEWLGIAGIIAAMVMLGFSLEGGVAQGATNARALVALTAAGIVAAAALWAAARTRASGVAEAIVSGIAFGLGSLYAKALADAFVAQATVAMVMRVMASPWFYLTIVANVGGLVLLQNSFHWARGIIAMPLSSACSNVVPIIGGMVAFAEVLPANRLAAAMRVGAYVMTIVAGAMLAVGEKT